MRAREFVINVPITIKIDGDKDPEIGGLESMANAFAKVAAKNTAPVKANDEPPKDPSELDPDPVMVPPLQQQIEINKAAVGKESPIIDELTQDEIDPEEEDTEQ